VAALRFPPAHPERRLARIDVIERRFPVALSPSAFMHGNPEKS
jgi:hypothetical protein